MLFKDLKIGDKFAEGLFVLSEAAIRQTKNTPPRNYLAITFFDGFEFLSGNIWNYGSTVVPAINTVYSISGSIGEYKGKKQLIIDTMEIAKEQDLAAFTYAYCEDIESLWAAAQVCIESIEHTDLRTIVQYIYQKYESKIKAATSAKLIHHVGSGGNLMHSLEVATICSALKSIYVLDITLNKDLLIAGALLHDIGKINTYTTTGAVIEYTMEGMLLDHIAIGIAILHEAIEELKKETCRSYFNCEILLKHLLLSHHGTPEKGSTVLPRISEAFILNYADQISATMDIARTASLTATEGWHTEKIFGLNNTEQLKRDMVALLLAE
jgi:3'-5' exoribonuclease